MTEASHAPSGELLLEVGTEELPATFVARATTDLAAAIVKGLDEARLSHGEVVGYGTPRRLIVSVPNVAAHQPDRTDRRRGPAIKGAYDAEGEPTKALLGFCRSQGIEPGDLENDGQYVWANVAVPGKPAPEILAELLPKAILGLQFAKSMRWGTSRLRFARPLRRILAAFAGERVGFAIEAIESGLTSAGHRFYAPEIFPASTLEELVTGLRARKVEPDPNRRRAMILTGITEVVGNDTAQISDALLDENVNLTEWPVALAGTFPETYLELPEPVLVTAMAKHERMFPVRAGDALTNRYIFVRNGGEDATVRAGTEWVLNARFNDARFFFDEDARLTLDDFLRKTEGILFQKDLGSVRARADRLAALAAKIAEATGADEDETELARRAGLYAKADLSTGLVGELPSLQGLIGGAYAAREGLPPEISAAIARQYEGEVAAPTDASGRTALRLQIADALDKLAGYLGVGLEPTGSSDPYALRRAATVLIEGALAWPVPIPSYEVLLLVALEGYKAQDHLFNTPSTAIALTDLFLARYPVLMPSVRYDVLEGALLKEYREEVTLPRNVAFRTRVLSRLAEDPAFIQTATRPMNIVATAKRKGIEYGWQDPLRETDGTKLGSPAGEELLTMLRRDEDAIFVAAREGDDESLIRLLTALKAPVDAYFEATLVMSEDPAERFARLTLAHAASLALLHAGDFTKLVIEG